MELTMPEKRKCELVLIRYVPDAVKGESINLGVAMFDQDWTTGSRFAAVRFTRDWKRVQCFHPDADLDVLQAVEMDLQSIVTNVRDGDLILRKIDMYASSGIVIEARQAVETTDAEAHLDAMDKYYLQIPSAPRSKSSGRAAIYGEMRKQFEK